MVAIQPKELTRISQSGGWKAYVVDEAERRNITPREAGLEQEDGNNSANGGSY